MKPFVLTMLIASLAFPCLAQERTQRSNPDLARSNSLKIYQSERFTVYFTGGFIDDVPSLVESGEKFLARLEREWAVILPENPIRVSLGRESLAYNPSPHFQAPDWLHCRYDPRHRRIDLRIVGQSNVDMRPVEAALQHQIVHYLLRLNETNKLPPVLEEGIAQHYSRPPGATSDALVVWGLMKHKDLTAYLTNFNSFTAGSDFPYAAAIAERYVAWLWRHNPDGKTQFLQQFLNGTRADRAFRGANFTRLEDNIPLFESVIRKQYPWYRIFLTLELWLIIMATTTLIWALVIVVKAAQTAHMIHAVSDELVQDVDDLVEEDAFGGPAFGNAADASPTTTASTGHTAPPPRRAVNPNAKAERRAARRREAPRPHARRPNTRPPNTPSVSDPQAPSLPPLPDQTSQVPGANKRPVSKQPAPSPDQPVSLPKIPDAPPQHRQPNEQSVKPPRPTPPNHPTSLPQVPKDTPPHDQVLPENLADDLDDLFDSLMGPPTAGPKPRREPRKPPTKPTSPAEPKRQSPSQDETLDNTDHQIDRVFSDFEKKTSNEP